jgi:type IV pilus assembly protein PilC
MQRYIYRARDEKGKLVRGIILADDELELANKISNLGFFLTGFKISQVSSPKPIKAKASRMNPREVLQFTFQLATLIDSGLPLLECLRDLARSEENERIQGIIDDVRYRVESGSSLKDALSAHPDSFSSLYRAIVGAGETTGKLASTLSDLAGILEWQQDLRAKIKQASVYPIILLCVMVVVVTLLTAIVIPRFAPIFEQAGMELPLLTQIVLNLSYFVRKYWFILLGGAIFLFIGYRIYSSRPGGRYRIDSLKLKLPIFGILFRKIALSRFAHTFALSFRTGVNLLTCLDIARATTGNARIQEVIARARDSVNVGEKLAASLGVSREFPPMVVRMIGVGEESGALAQTLEKVANYYDKEVASTIQRIFTLFEPIMIVLMGGIVGTIALSVFLPMFQMAEAIGG